MSKLSCYHYSISRFCDSSTMNLKILHTFYIFSILPTLLLFPSFFAYLLLYFIPPLLLYFPTNLTANLLTHSLSCLLTRSNLSLLQSTTLTPIIFIPLPTPPHPHSTIPQALTLKIPFDLAQLWSVRSTDFSDFLTIFTQTGMRCAFISPQHMMILIQCSPFDSYPYLFFYTLFSLPSSFYIFYLVHSPTFFL